MLLPHIDLSRGPLRPDVARAIQALRDRIEQLEELLGAAPDECERFAVFKVPTICRRMLSLLMKRGVVAREAAHALIYGGLPEHRQPELKSLDIHIWRLRQGLRVHGIKIEAVWGVGWYLTPDDKAKISALIGEASPCA